MITPKEKEAFLRIAGIISERKKEMSRDLGRLIGINTVNELVVRDRVRCRNKSKVFAFIRALAKKRALHCYSLAERGLVLEYGEGKDVLDVPCHLDVVQAGKNWKTDPFRASVRRGRIYGRGAIDNKGPCISALYALSALKDSGVKLSKKIRLIFCCDEESGVWDDMRYCVGRLGQPFFALVHDSHFPIVNSEKGFLDVHVSFSRRRTKAEGPGVRLTHFSGGLRSNMVPDHALAVLDTSGAICRKSFNNELRKKIKSFLRAEPKARIRFFARDSYEKKNGKIPACKGDIVLEARGRSAHASQPKDGRNAISDLAVFLGGRALISEYRSIFVSWIAKKIKRDNYGRCFGIQCAHPKMGRLTVNLGQVTDAPGCVSMILNIRYPFGAKQNDIISKIRKNCPPHVKIKAEANSMKPLYINPGNEAIKKLAGAFFLATGKRAFFVSMAGTTYAKLFKAAVGYGPIMPREQSTAHMANEWISAKMLTRNSEILASAFLMLCGENTGQT